MRRVLPLIAALAALALPALADAASSADVIRDCTLDGKLDKTYSQKELRQALAAIPSDVDEYTNCRDVIRNAQLAAATSSSSGRGASNSSGAGTAGGGTTGGGTTGGTATGGDTSGTTAGVFGGFPTVPGGGVAAATPAEKAAIASAVEEVSDDDPVEKAGVALPTSLIGALAVGGLALLVFVALDIRRRVVDRRGL